MKNLFLILRLEPPIPPFLDLVYSYKKTKNLSLKGIFHEKFNFLNPTNEVIFYPVKLF